MTRAARRSRISRSWGAPSIAWKATSSPVEDFARPEASRCSYLPNRERHVLDAVVRLGPAGPTEFADARVRRLEPDDAFEVGDRDEQWSVGVALPQQRIDLQHRVGGIPRIDAGAVVDDSLEDGQGSEPHVTMLVDAGR